MNRIKRMIHVMWVTSRYRLDYFLPTEHLPFRFRLLLWIMPWRLLIAPKNTPAVNLRLALEALGPVFVKFGQILSTRRDLMPTDIADELAKLQDQVPAFPGHQARAIIESQLGQSVEALFATFDEIPLASASVAQVHPATLHSGESVVVKVIRPDIERVILKDLALLKTLAQWITKIPDGKRLRPNEVVEDYHKTILDELDLIREGSNAVTLRRNFEHSSLLYIPEVHWAYTSKSVLTMERIHGIGVSDIAALKAQGTDMKKLAERGVEIFFTQVFRDSFFHADMHPGNVFVSREHPENPSYIGIDCGIVGSLSEADLTYLALTLLAFFNRDYRQVAQLYVDSGWVPRDTRVHEFESAIRAVCEPIFQKPLSEISFGLVLIRLFQTARRFDMEVQPQLVLLQKTLLNIEGLGRQLYPELDLWATAKPYLETWFKDRLHPLTAAQRAWRNAPGWLEKAPQLPDMVFAALKSYQTNEASQSLQMMQIQTALQQSQRAENKRQWRWLASLCLVAGFAIPSMQPTLTAWVPALYLGASIFVFLSFRG
jgi:ubiquinone biosynthesis protein